MSRGRHRVDAATITHQVGPLDRLDVTEYDHIPVTTPERTILDLAAVVPRAHVEAALDDAVLRKRVSLERVRRSLDRWQGKPGVKVLRAILAARAHGTRVPESEAERKAMPLFARARLKPVRQYEIRRHGALIGRVDFAFPAERVAIEIDGRETHDTDDAFEQDRYRDAQLHALGWRVLRFTWRDVTQRPQHFIGSVQRVLRRARTA